MMHWLYTFLIFFLVYSPGFLFAQRQAKILNHIDRVRITKLTTLNSSYRETNLSITPDGKYLFFMSMRGGQPWSESYMTYKGRPMWDGDIWYSEKRNGKWQFPRCLPPTINSGSGEDEPNISVDGNTVYYQSWRTGIWFLNGGPYYKAERKGKSWGEPKGLGGGITQFFKQMRATDGMTMSPDQRTLIVAAARDDYDDNMDIYISHKGRYGWRFCRKLPISTSGDERSVFMAGDGRTIYFASDAYGGMGGLDIYKTTLINDSTMGEVINLGPPFNTPQDDFGFILTADGNEAYFVRNGDIYFADIKEADDAIKPVLPKNVQLVLKGVVRDKESQEGIKANVVLLDAKTKRVISKIETDRAGKYEIQLPNKSQDYDQLVHKDGYQNARKNLSVASSIKDKTYQNHFALIPEKKPEPEILADNKPSDENQSGTQESRPQPILKPIDNEADEKITQPNINSFPNKVEEVEDPYSFDGVAKNNLILLLDVSASMQKPGKLPLLKTAFTKLLQHMRAEDRVSVIVYSGEAKVILSGVSAIQKDYIAAEIEKLRSGGSTKGKGALRRAYKIAEDNFIGAGNNRIIMATDGDFDIPDLYSLVNRNSNINLSVFAFGKLPKYKIDELEALAERGGGNFASVTQKNIDVALLAEAKAVRE